MEIDSTASEVSGVVTPPPPTLSDAAVSAASLASVMASVTTVQPLVTPSKLISSHALASVGAASPLGESSSSAGVQQMGTPGRGSAASSTAVQLPGGVQQVGTPNRGGIAASQSLTASSALSDASPASALMNAVHEELRLLAGQLTSSEPNVQHIRNLHSILSEALRRSDDAGACSSPSRQLASNLASVAATHCVRMMTFNGVPSPVPNPSQPAASSPASSQVCVVSASLPSEATNGSSWAAKSEKTPTRMPVRTNTGTRVPHATQASEESQEMYLKADPMLVRLEEPGSKASVWRYRCRQCRLYFDHRHELEAHFSEHRTLKKSWICHVCGKTFTRADHLNRHSQSHDLPEFICQICGCAFSRCSFLDRHWRLAHGSIIAVPSIAHEAVKRPAAEAELSPLSSEPLAKQKRVMHHESSIGSPSTPSASSASVAASQLADLQVKAAALAEAMAGTPGAVSLPPIATPTNQAGSVAAAAAAVGVTPISQKPRPTHPCPMCDKMFIRFDHMLRHKRVHTGEKPFFCALCAKRYTRADYLREHIVSQHNTTNVRCKVCNTVFPFVTLYRSHTCSQGEPLRNWYMQGEFLDQSGNIMQPCLVISKDNAETAALQEEAAGADDSTSHLDMSAGEEPTADAGHMPSMVSAAGTVTTTTSGPEGNMVTICALPVVTVPGADMSMLNPVVAASARAGPLPDHTDTTTVHVTSMLNSDRDGHLPDDSHTTTVHVTSMLNSVTASGGDGALADDTETTTVHVEME